MRYEREVGGLTVRKSGNGWEVCHSASGLRAFDGKVRQRRFAEQARTELLATGVDFTAEPAEIQRHRPEWKQVYYKWGNRARQSCFDRETFEFYGTDIPYSSFVPSAAWAQAMREAVAAGDTDAMTRLLNSHGKTREAESEVPGGAG